MRRDLTITGDIFKTCMLLASISDGGEYEAVIEAIRGVPDEDGATNYKAVKNRLLGSFSDKHPEKGSIFGSKRIQAGYHKHGKSVRVTLARDAKDSITCYNCGKNGHYPSDCRSKQNTKGKASTSRGKPTKGKGSSSKSPKDSFMIMAAVAESDNEEDPYESDHSKEDCDVYESTYAFTSKVDSSFLKYPHLTETAFRAVTTRTVFNQDNQCKFLVDSGASHHICNDVRMYNAHL
jgi:Zinc knuckle